MRIWLIPGNHFYDGIKWSRSKGKIRLIVCWEKKSWLVLKIRRLKSFSSLFSSSLLLVKVIRFNKQLKSSHKIERLEVWEYDILGYSVSSRFISLTSRHRLMWLPYVCDFCTTKCTVCRSLTSSVPVAFHTYLLYDSVDFMSPKRTVMKIIIVHTILFTF